jgi:hypothetical protein
MFDKMPKRYIFLNRYAIDFFYCMESDYTITELILSFDWTAVSTNMCPGRL